MGKKNATLYNDLRKKYQEAGDADALDRAKALLAAQQNISIGDRERLLGYLEGGGKVILPEPQALLTPESKVPGIDGEKMSKSYGNTIGLREAPEEVEKKLRTMPTDPQRVRRTDPGDPEKCPVWKFHQIYSTDEVKNWVQQGCRSAGIGCIECKQPVIDGVLKELKPIRERALEYSEDIDAVRTIVDEGCEKAREVARETMEEVREAMGISYR
jgi:tryptophanyl-tRNA synthetase